MPSATLYAPIFSSAFLKLINLLADTNKVALATTTYTPDTDLHDFFNDITNEASGTGYTAGGATLANDTFVYTAGTNTWRYDADDVSWPSSTITARYAIVYDSTPGTAATNPLMCLFDFDTNQSTSNGTFAIAWNASGLWEITS
jgi:hypothetical protein